ncbi:MAG: response regulator [Acidobacteriaceae bacterium]
MARKAFALVILDVMLPGIDGFEVLERLRHFSEVPVLMLTTRGAASDRIRGLKSAPTTTHPNPSSLTSCLPGLSRFFAAFGPPPVG